MIALLVATCLTGCKKEQHQNYQSVERNLRTTNTNIKIVMLGDSETRRINHYWGLDTNWNTLMEFDTVLNYGFDAWGTWHMLYVWGQSSPLYLAMNQNPDLLCILIGINDAHQNVPLSETLDNYRTIIDSVQGRGINLVFQSVLPTTNYYDTLYGGFPTNGVLALRAKIMNDSLYHICTQRAVPFLDIRPGLVTDIFTRSGVAYLKSDKSIDGIHINYIGYEIWRDHLTNWLIANEYL